MARASGARVLTVIDSLSAGGAQSHLLALAREMNRGPYRTDVFSLVSLRDFYSKEFEAIGSRVHFGGYHPAELPLVMARFMWLVARSDYDIVHSYLPASFLFAVLPGRVAGRRKHVTTICARVEQISSRILSFGHYRRFEGATDLYITPFPGQARELGIPEQKVRYSLFAADYEPDRFIASRAANPFVARFGLEDAFPVMLTIGRMHPDKGHTFAIAAQRKLVATWPKARLLILGEGYYEPEVRKAAEGVPGVIFAGLHKDLAPVYSAADLYLNMAVNEGLNLAQLRAMAYGVPSLAFQTGFLEYEQEGREMAVRRVPIGDVDALARAMGELAADAAGRAELGRAGQAFAAQYDSRRVVADYTRFYEELDAGTRS